VPPAVVPALAVEPATAEVPAVFALPPFAVPPELIAPAVPALEPVAPSSPPHADKAVNSVADEAMKTQAKLVFRM
jgi:hypothetical protein